MNDIKSVIESLKKKNEYQALSMDGCPNVSDSPSKTENQGTSFEDLISKVGYKINKKRFPIMKPLLIWLLVVVLPFGMLVFTDWKELYIERLVALCLGLLVVSAFGVNLLRILQSLTSNAFEEDSKLKERILNEIIRVFNENQEYERLEYKTKMSLYERYEKARIDEWVHNLEHLRRLQEMEQERLAKADDKIVELSKVVNKVKIFNNPTINNPVIDKSDIDKSIIIIDKSPIDKSVNGKSIEIEQSILSSDLSDDMKGIIQSLLK